MTESNMIPAKVKQMNTTALAYMGDAVYEVYVRRHVMESGQINADRLHYMAVPFVRAHGQATALKEMMKGFLTEEEASLATTRLHPDPKMRIRWNISWLRPLRRW